MPPPTDPSVINNPHTTLPYFPLPRPFPAAAAVAAGAAAAAPGAAPGAPLLLLRLALCDAAAMTALPALVLAATLFPPPCKAPVPAAAAAAAAFGLLLLLRGCGDMPRPLVRPALAVGDTNVSDTASVT